MVNDKEVIQAAYEDSLKTLFNNFRGDYLLCKGDPKKKSEAEERFTTGVNNAREARDRALVIVK